MPTPKKKTVVCKTFFLIVKVRTVMKMKTLHWHDERNINHIRVDKYVSRNGCKTEINSESGNKKAKFPF